MNVKRIDPYFSLLAIFFSMLSGTSQQISNRQYEVELSSFISNENQLPFWLTANKFGSIPTSNNGIIKTSIFSDFKNSNSNFSFSYKAAISGYVATESDVLVNELYGSIKYKSLILDLGSKNDEVNFEGLSISNGDIIKSTNTKAFPGINFHSNGFIKLPFAKNWLTTKFNYAEYLLTDDRIVDKTHVHYKSLFFKSKLSEKSNLTLGLNHFVQWGGKSDEFGKQPNSFSDYLRIIRGSSGGSNSYEGEQINALGNHLGSYLIQFDHLGDRTNWSAYWSHPFEDRSGRELMNYPDAIYGVFLNFKKPQSFITHLMAEITYTKHMSGERTISGNDNYFNNVIYSDGWTYFGRTIGSPLFLTKPKENEYTPGITQNRFISYHIGLKGLIFESITYKSTITFTNYPGWFQNPNPSKNQLSAGFECIFPEQNLPFIISLGVAFDHGDFAPFNVGGFAKITKTGKF